MNSKQLNFFMTSNDPAEVALFLKERNCLIVKNHVKNTDDAFVETSALFDQDIFKVFVLHETYINDIYFEYSEPQGHCYVDIVRSNLLEFNLGGFYPYSNKELHRSRLYYVTKYYKNAESVAKDDEFVKWNDGLLRTFKKKFLRKTSITDFTYFTDNAGDWYNKQSAEMSSDGSKLIIK